MQVNTGEEPQKAGVLPREAAALIAHARKLELPVAGLMCIPPADDDAAPHFALLAKLARDHGLGDLSMGMSGDFEMAVRFGATHVRVGTAIFGRSAIVCAIRILIAAAQAVASAAQRRSLHSRQRDTARGGRNNPAWPDAGRSRCPCPAPPDRH